MPVCPVVDRLPSTERHSSYGRVSKCVCVYVCVLCPRIDPLRFLAGCRRRRLNHGLVVALYFFSLLDRACVCVILFGLWVHATFSLSVPLCN